MHNPYATSPASENAPPTSQFSSPENTRASDYEDAIGPNTDYYLPRFEKYDSHGAGVSWHWPAFFATSSWYVYRKLYLLGILNFFYPWILWFAFGLLIGLRVMPPDTGGLLILLLSPLPWLLLTLFANRIYWRRVSQIIAETPAYPDAGRRRRELQLVGGVARGPMVAMVAFTVLFFVGFIGFGAAIAIPAYQDYTIRSQVTEGLNLASAAKAEVAEFHAQHREWPKQADLGGDPPHGLYTESVVVEEGTVIVRYGGKANRNISGKRLALHPAVNENGDIVWACGNASIPDGYVPSDGPHGSEVPDKYLPAACRTQ
jgi:type IV pilus assembly protein PilA